MKGVEASAPEGPVTAWEEPPGKISMTDGCGGFLSNPPVKIKNL